MRITDLDPVFPTKVREPVAGVVVDLPGIERRDLFAMVAMHALISNGSFRGEIDTALDAYGCADAMIEISKK